MKFLIILICLILGGCMTLPFGTAKYFELNHVENKIDVERKEYELAKMERKNKNKISTTKWNLYWDSSTSRLQFPF